MSLDDLQRTIDASIAGASSLTRSVFENNQWSAQQMQDFANEGGRMTIATVGKDGRPHAGVVIAACVDGTFYFGASPKSAMLGNLRREPYVGFTVADNVVGRGTAQLAGRAFEMERIGPQASNLMRSLIDQRWSGYVYSIELERLFAQRT